MRKIYEKIILFMCYTFFGFKFQLYMVSAEESRVPSNIEFTQYDGRSIEPEYEYKNVNARGVSDV